MKQYKKFIFDSYTFNKESKVLELHYSIDDLLHFTETYKFKIDEIIDDNPVALERTFDLLFLMAGVSYYKTYLPPEIVINNVEIDEPMSKFLQKTWQKGLGEFFYVNKLDPLTAINFPVTTNDLSPTNFSNSDGKLLAIGGGKDSLLSLEMLRNKNPTTWACNHEAKLKPLVDKLGTKHISVERTWDAQLATLNSEDAYNGHVPISAIFACVGLVLSALTGKRDIIVSNESSANAATLEYKGQSINHQYSKTLEFEQDYQSILVHLFDDSRRYYSLLRPYTELSIAERFSPYFAKYSRTFCSCNKAFTLVNASMGWCGKCPKCAFSYLIFAPFIPQKQLNKLFGGKNLLNDTSLRQTYEELLGTKGVKPLDCVGEVEECRVAYKKATKIGLVDNPIDFVEPINYDFKKLHKHLVPDDAYNFD